MSLVSSNCQNFWNLSCLTLSCTFTTIQVQLFVDIYNSFMYYTLSSKMQKEVKVKYLSYIYLSYFILNLSLNLFDNILIVSVIFNAFPSYIILEGSNYILSLTFFKILIYHKHIIFKKLITKFFENRLAISHKGLIYQIATYTLMTVICTVVFMNNHSNHLTM
jgi:hypothetical protein